VTARIKPSCSQGNIIQEWQLFERPANQQRKKFHRFPTVTFEDDDGFKGVYLLGNIPQKLRKQ
jgi:hypothetical protein